MNKITIIAEDPKSPHAAFRAAWRDRESVGRTAGAALDALTEQMQPSDTGTLIVVQNLQPDIYFTASQQRRLQELLDKRRESELNDAALSAKDQSELETLVVQELDGTTRRAAAMANELGL